MLTITDVPEWVADVMLGNAKGKVIKDCVEWLGFYCKSNKITQIPLKKIKSGTPLELKNILTLRWQERLEEDFINIENALIEIKKKYEVKIGKDFLMLLKKSGKFKIYIFDDSGNIDDNWLSDVRMMSDSPLIVINLFGAIKTLNKSRQLQLVVDGDTGWSENFISDAPEWSSD